MWRLAKDSYNRPDPNLVTFYRGAAPTSALGLSWTSSLNWARFFAGRYLEEVDQGLDRAGVFMTTVDSGAVLCDLAQQWPYPGWWGECEFVIDSERVTEIDLIEEIPRGAYRERPPLNVCDR